jgi:MarR family transcriptional repressor of emrRAB
MAEVLPELPSRESTMIRLFRIGVMGLGRYFDPVFRKIGLPESAYHALCLLVASEGGKASPSLLSDMVGTSRANMTRIVETLAGGGLIVRDSDDSDGRRQTIAITASGREFATNALPILAEPVRQAFSDLTEEEFAQLDFLLRKAIASFDKEAPLAHVAGQRIKKVAS